MPGWGEILTELTNTRTPNGGIDLDGVRTKYLKALQERTGRSVVVYATDFLGKSGPQCQIGLVDMQGLMEVFRDLPGPDLDLIIHSPGGQAEATDRLVRYMRSKYDHVRVFVPLAAMSAATMWAMAADEIVMGKHSQLGPIDPQVQLPSGITVPAGALIDQFKEASEECAVDPTRISAWLPTLQQYPPGLLKICESATKLAQELVKEWLRSHMLKDDDARDSISEKVAEWLADDDEHLSHGRAITRDQLVAYGLRVTDLEADQDLQDAVLSVFHVTTQSFSGSAAKIIENHLGRRFVQHGGQMITVPIQQAPPQAPAPPPPPAMSPPTASVGS